MSQRLSVVAVFAFVLPLANHAPPAELKPHTLEAFLSYATATEARFLAEATADDSFLYIDHLAGREREEALASLTRGEVLMERLKTKAADGSEIKIKDGLIHHWVGTVFIPGATLEDTLALLQDYNRHAEIYAPQVEQARIVDRDGDNFTVFYRFRKKKILTAVHKTTHDANYYRRGPTHAYSISKSTDIREVQNPGEPDERELPEDNNRGLLWAINSYWKLLEVDGGTFVESESVSLTRSIPILAVPIVRPFVTGVPRELLAFTLEITRDQLAQFDDPEGSQEPLPVEPTLPSSGESSGGTMQ